MLFLFLSAHLEKNIISSMGTFTAPIQAYIISVPYSAIMD